MNRRNALSAVAVLFGGTIIGAEAFLSGCKTPVKKEGLFSTDDLSFLDEVGETILPTTASSPGAKAAKIGDFMKTIVTDCYDEKEQKIFEDGLVKLQAASNKKYSKDFLDLDAAQRHDLLVELDKEAKDYQKTKTRPAGRTGQRSERLPEIKKTGRSRTLFYHDQATDALGLFHFRDRGNQSSPVYCRSGPLRRLHPV